MAGGSSLGENKCGLSSIPVICSSVTPPAVVIGRFDPETYVAPSVDETTGVLDGIAVSPGVVRIVMEPVVTNEGQ